MVMAVLWEDVRLFISSIFNDLHAARGCLVKRVFPGLPDWCARRRLRLVDIDLRWGVAEEDATANADAVRSWLNRIDDCRPFFVCFLGQRYGWIPKNGDIAPKISIDFPGREFAIDAGTSSTALEILSYFQPTHRG
jgi:hypothetical protein